jgi:hypothetical protein
MSDTEQIPENEVKITETEPDIESVSVSDTVKISDTEPQIVEKIVYREKPVSEKKQASLKRAREGKKRKREKDKKVLITKLPDSVTETEDDDDENPSKRRQTALTWKQSAMKYGLLAVLTGASLYVKSNKMFIPASITEVAKTPLAKTKNFFFKDTGVGIGAPGGGPPNHHAPVVNFENKQALRGATNPFFV